MTIPEFLADGAWRKSRRSMLGNHCVEVRRSAAGTEVRDSKDPVGPTLRFDEPAWRCFIASLKSGAMDTRKPDTT